MSFLTDPIFAIIISANATLAQLVEHLIRNEKVASSILAGGSTPYERIMKRLELFKQSLANRSYAIAFIVTSLVLIAILIFGAVKIRPSDIQVPMRNTVFGVTYTYSEQWYNQLTFVGFAIILAVLNTAFSVKLFHLKGEYYGIAFQWLTAILLGMTFVTLLAIFRVISVIIQ